MDHKWTAKMDQFYIAIVTDGGQMVRNNTMNVNVFPSGPDTRGLVALALWQYGTSMVKVTFTFDSQTVETLRRTALKA